MSRYALSFEEIDETHVAIVGGKGANLGELSRIEGIQMPRGFCITTNAFLRLMSDARSAQTASIDDQLERLSHLKADDREGIRTVSAELRQTVERIPIPDDVAAAITSALARNDEHAAYAVRSSATTEDSPTASFAGQHDTYLNVVGAAAILQSVSRCWASLFSERAVAYRLQNGLDHRNVQMGLVVQRMVFPHASGILFTADPITGNRRVSSIDASFGLGEALVAGLVNPDVYKVRDGVIVSRSIGAKKLIIQALSGGGTHQQALEPERQNQPTLTNAQVVRVAELGRRIETHFGRPQDIEWCLVDDDFQFVQSRPITTLFPVPEVADGENHVYLSVGHNQMMTDAIKPLGLSFWQLTTPRPMAEAGGRLFVDVTQTLAAPSSRAGILEMTGKSDPLFRDALQSVLKRGNFIRLIPNDILDAARPDDASANAPSSSCAKAPLALDPAIVTRLIASSEASVATLKRDIKGKSGTALLDFIVEDIRELKRILFDP
ncbi:MAG: PEP/pyruvate-binding domain-containing protein, partial [Gemmatimonadaceae bacterium]